MNDPGADLSTKESPHIQPSEDDELCLGSGDIVQPSISSKKNEDEQAEEDDKEEEIHASEDEEGEEIEEQGEEDDDDQADDDNETTDDDNDLTDDEDVKTDDELLSDDTEFAILDKDSENNSEDEKGFSIINADSLDVSSEHVDRDGNEEDEAEEEMLGGNESEDEQDPMNQSDVQKSLDAYINNPGRNRQRRAFVRQKVKKIEHILSQTPVDVAELRQQAISRGGLLSSHLRRKVWPLLLNVNPDNIPTKPDKEVLTSHNEYHQVVMDVNRSIRRFPPGMKDAHRSFLQDKLVDVIMRVLVRHPELHYYQGFHDICVTFLLVVEEDMAFALAEKLAASHLRDFMEATMDRTQQLLDYVPPLIRRANPELHQYMEKAQLGTMYGISWLLTWFGHVLSDIESILRFYDFFIACHPLMPIYVVGAVVLYREKEILAAEPDISELFPLLNDMPDNLPFEHLLSNAGDLYLQYPPTELANEAIRRFKRNQQEAAARRAQGLSRLQGKGGASRSKLPDNNVTFTKVTVCMLGAVASVAAYALLSGLGWDWTSWMPQ